VRECRYGSGCVKRATCPFAHPPPPHPTRALSLRTQQHSNSLAQLSKGFQGLSIKRHGQNGLSVSKSRHAIQRGKGHVSFKSEKKEVKVAKVSVPARGAGKKQRQPVFVSFLIDTSGSMSGSKLQAVKEGLPKILKLLDDDDLVFIQTFDSTIEKLTPRPTKPSELDQSLIGSLETRGATKLHDAITTTLPNFKKASKRLPVLVVLTDGDDTWSSSSASDAKSALQKPGISNFHAVLIGVGSEAKNALRAIDPQKPHTSLHSVADSAKGIQKAFQWLSQKIKTFQVVQITTIQREVRVVGGGGTQGLPSTANVQALLGGSGVQKKKSWKQR
jgi:Mg-chelatase subunit ChlD